MKKQHYKDLSIKKEKGWRIISHSLLFLVFVGVSAISNAQVKYFVTKDGGGSRNGSSWENSASDLNLIINKANKNDSIWVATGVYEGGFIMKDGVSVFGGFAGTEENFAERKLPATGENLTTLDGKFQYRVVTQQTDFSSPTIWDGFIIENGLAVDGGGTRLMANGILRLCIIRNNQTGYPSVGDYVAEQGGIVFRTDNINKKAWIIAPESQGRTYSIGVDGLKQTDQLANAIADLQGSSNSDALAARKARAMEAMKNYRSSVNNKLDDWYIPSAGEWAFIISSDNLGTNSAFHLVNNALEKNGFQPLDGDRYWSSTTAKQYGLWAGWYADFVTGNLNKLNIYQYNKVRGIRSFDMTSTNGKGGAIFALAGSRIEGCLIIGNNAFMGSAVCARGNVNIINSTICNNLLTASSSSNAVDGNADVKVYNTIITSNMNSVGGVANYDDKIVYAYSAVETTKALGGIGNLALNSGQAGFVDILSHDYRLTESSICIGAGSLLYLPVNLTLDLAGKKRPENGRVSIGAFEPYKTSGIEDNLSENIYIYPSSVYAGGRISVNTNTANEFDFEIYGLLGQLVKYGNSATNRITAPDSEGVYLLRINMKEGVSYDFRIIVKN